MSRPRKRSAVFHQGKRSSMGSATPVQRKSKYRCRGLRQWCDERCERSTSLVPTGYPKVGFYCPLHAFQRPGGLSGSDEPKPKFKEFCLQRVPSYKRFAAEEEKKSALVSNDQAFILKMREATPTVITKHTVGGKAYERAFLGKHFVTWLTRANAAKFTDPMVGMGYGQTLLEGGLIVCLSDSSRDARFTFDAVYQLAEDAAAAAGDTLSVARAATVRISILAGRKLAAFKAKKRTSSPYVKVAYRDIGPKSDKSRIIKVGRTNICFKTLAPQFGVTKSHIPPGTPGRLLKFKINDPPAGNPIGEVVRSKIVDWRRDIKPKKAAPEWDEAKSDPYTFEFRVPQPRMVYKDHIENLPFKRCPGDIHIVAWHLKSKMARGEGFLGEIRIPVANLVLKSDDGEETGRACVMRWISLSKRPEDKRTAEDEAVAGQLLVRLQMLLPTDDHDEFDGESGDDSDSDSS